MFLNKKYSIKEDENNLIFIINSLILDDKLFCAIKKEFKNNKKIGFDMGCVISIKSKKFIKSLTNNEIKLFNLQNEVLVYLSIILKSSLLNSFICENDFISNNYELVKRRFLVA